MKLEKLLEMIQKRPNHFFEKKDLTVLGSYISGFLMSKESLGVIEDKEFEFKCYFSRFVAQELLQEEEIAWHKMLHAHENGWDLFFELAHRFLSQETTEN